MKVWKLDIAIKGEPLVRTYTPPIEEMPDATLTQIEGLCWKWCIEKCISIAGQGKTIEGISIYFERR